MSCEGVGDRCSQECDYIVPTVEDGCVVCAKLVKIGNSRGLRLAKPLLEQAGLSDEVEIQAAPGVLTIRPAAAPRAVYRAKLTGSLQKNEYDNLFLSTDIENCTTSDTEK